MTMHDHHGGPPKESPWVVTVPLILLAIPSIFAGWMYIEPMLFGDFFGNSIVVLERHAVMAEMKEEWHGVWRVHRARPHEPALLAGRRRHRRRVVPVSRQAGAAGAHRDGARAALHAARQQVLLRHVQRLVLRGRRARGRQPLLQRRRPDDHRRRRQRVGRGWWAGARRCCARIQSGYVYHYAFTMIIGLFALLIWWVPR